MPYRPVYLGLALIALAAIVLGVAFAGGGEPVELPLPLEGVAPTPGEAVLRQAVVEVDLPAGYQATIYIDGFPIPPAEVVVVEATGVHSWRPSVEGRVFQEWTPGLHTVRVTWDRGAGLPDPGAFEWSFRVQ
jgi:hypothetical protein